VGLHHKRITDPLCYFNASSTLTAMPDSGIGIPSLFHNAAEKVSVLGQVNCLLGGAEDSDAGLFKLTGNIKRRLPAEGNDNAERGFSFSYMLRTSSTVSGSK
jgi:hypothetical protein